nr:uncharacterized protein LOC105875136 isoform X2 [Microcebus murinus]
MTTPSRSERVPVRCTDSNKILLEHWCAPAGDAAAWQARARPHGICVLQWGARQHTALLFFRKLPQDLNHHKSFSRRFYTFGLWQQTNYTHNTRAGTLKPHSPLLAGTLLDSANRGHRRKITRLEEETCSFLFSSLFGNGKARAEFNVITQPPAFHTTMMGIRQRPLRQQTCWDTEINIRGNS